MNDIQELKRASTQNMGWRFSNDGGQIVTVIPQIMVRGDNDEQLVLVYPSDYHNPPEEDDAIKAHVLEIRNVAKVGNGFQIDTGTLPLVSIFPLGPSASVELREAVVEYPRLTKAQVEEVYGL